VEKNPEKKREGVVNIKGDKKGVGTATEYQ